MPHPFIARQPIYDRYTRVALYELRGSDRSSNRNSFLISALSELGIAHLLRGLPALIQLYHQPEHVAFPPWPFPSETPIGISYPLSPNALRQPIPYESSATFICLDGVVTSSRASLPAQVHFVRLDAAALGPDGVTDQIENLRSRDLEIIVSGITSAEEFDLYHALGVDYFQGSFLAVSRRLYTPKVLADQQTVLTLLATLQGDPDTDELRNIITRDIGLSYKLLAYINSASFGTRRRFSSVREAIIYLGRAPLSKWASLVLIAGLKSAPEELRRQALVRARLCERLAEVAQEANTGAYFTTGLLSLLDVLLDRPMADVLNVLPLHPAVEEAISTGAGKLGEALACARDHEHARWRHEHYLGVGADIIVPAYTETTHWADEAMNEITKP